MYATSHVVSRNASPAITALYRRDVNYDLGASGLISILNTPKRFTGKQFGRDIGKGPVGAPGEGSGLHQEKPPALTRDNYR